MTKEAYFNYLDKVQSIADQIANGYDDCLIVFKGVNKAITTINSDFKICGIYVPGAGELWTYGEYTNDRDLRAEYETIKDLITVEIFDVIIAILSDPSRYYVIEY